MEKQNLLLFRDNYRRQLFLFNIKFFSRLNITLDYSSNGIIRVIKKNVNKYSQATNAIPAFTINIIYVINNLINFLLHFSLYNTYKN